MEAKLNKAGRRALQKAEGEGVYLYCIIPRGAKNNHELSGIGNSSVYAIPYNDLVAIVSSVPMKEYEPTEENAKAHKDVALSFLQDNSVLPVAFGMVFKNKKILLANMRKVYSLLKASLLAVTDKVELGLKVVLPEEANFEGLSNGKSRDEFIKELEKDFLEKAGSVAIHSKKGKLFSDRLALNASFLVAKESIGKVSEEVGNLGKKYPQLKIQYSGPWPAYNFVDIKIMSKTGGSV